MTTTEKTVREWADELRQRLAEAEAGSHKIVELRYQEAREIIEVLSGQLAAPPPQEPGGMSGERLEEIRSFAYDDPRANALLQSRNAALRDLLAERERLTEALSVRTDKATQTIDHHMRAIAEIARSRDSIRAKLAVALDRDCGTEEDTCLKPGDGLCMACERAGDAENELGALRRELEAARENWRLDSAAKRDEIVRLDRAVSEAQGKLDEIEYELDHSTEGFGEFSATLRMILSGQSTEGGDRPADSEGSGKALQGDSVAMPAAESAATEPEGVEAHQPPSTSAVGDELRKCLCPLLMECPVHPELSRARKDLPLLLEQRDLWRRKANLRKRELRRVNKAMAVKCSALELEVRRARALAAELASKREGRPRANGDRDQVAELERVLSRQSERYNEACDQLATVERERDAALRQAQGLMRVVERERGGSNLCTHCGGGKKSLEQRPDTDVQHLVDCPHCHGTGEEPPSPEHFASATIPLRREDPAPLLGRCLQLLERLQDWSGWEGEPGHCAICDALPGNAHDTDCELAAVIKELKEPK